MKFTMGVDMDNDVFGDDDVSRGQEVRRITTAVVREIMRGELAGRCRDLNGNTCGEWHIIGSSGQ